jgi:predicted nucleic acid-binding protein
MSSAILSDTSCLILLEKIGELEVLHELFGAVITTPEVAAEFGLPLPVWVTVKPVVNRKYQSIIEASVDQGEASAIALAVEYDDCLLIIDDLKGRKFAQQIGLSITGTFGVLLEAKRAGVVPLMKPLLEKIKQTNFRLSAKLEALVLTQAQE